MGETILASKIIAFTFTKFNNMGLLYDKLQI